MYQSLAVVKNLPKFAVSGPVKIGEGSPKTNGALVRTTYATYIRDNIKYFVKYFADCS